MLDHRIVLFALATAAIAACSAAQRALPLVPGRPDPARQLVLRETARDAAGQLQWQEFEARPCATCDGSKRQPCQACRGEHRLAKRCGECKGKFEVPCPKCVGSGEALDPLVQLPCPRCEGRVHIVCIPCGGIGRILVNTDQQPCRACSRKGGYRCAICKGKRAIDLFAGDARRLEDAELEPLHALNKGLQDQLQQLREFLPKLRRPRSVTGAIPMAEVERQHAQLVEVVEQWFPEFRREPKSLAAINKAMHKYDGAKLYLGGPIAPYQTIPLNYRRSVEAMAALLNYQQQAVARCLERLEKNASKR